MATRKKHSLWSRADAHARPSCKGRGAGGRRRARVTRRWVQLSKGRAFSANIVGLALLRTTSTNQGGDTATLRTLKRHLRSLGRDVPVVAFTNEEPGQVDHWDGRADIDLRAAPYNLEVLDA